MPFGDSERSLEGVINPSQNKKPAKATNKPKE